MPPLANALITEYLKPWHARARWWKPELGSVCPQLLRAYHFDFDVPGPVLSQTQHTIGEAFFSDDYVPPTALMLPAPVTWIEFTSLYTPIDTNVTVGILLYPCPD